MVLEYFIFTIMSLQDIFKLFLRKYSSAYMCEMQCFLLICGEKYIQCIEYAWLHMLKLFAEC